MTPPRFNDLGRMQQLNVLLALEANRYRGGRPGARPMKHGTRGGYQRKCRCAECVAANRAYNRGRRANPPALPDGAHGSNSTYVQYGCRCDRCKQAHADDAASYRAAKAVNQEEQGERR